MATVRQRLLSIFGGSVGNLIEWYDFYIYSAFSLYFAKSFFPSDNPVVEQLNTAAVFALGFLIRPVGGWVMGLYADLRGRRAALSLSVTLMLLALAVGLTDLTFAAKTFVGPTARWTGIPLLMFASVGILGSAGDFRVLRAGPLRGSARIARHLWRMSFALFIAALSFFIGQAKVIPKPIRIVPLLVLPVLAVLVTMLYWMWRVRVRRATYGQVFGSRSHVHRFPSHVG